MQDTGIFIVGTFAFIVVTIGLIINIREFRKL